MIACTHCQTQNGLDSRFCKNCGKALEDDAVQQATKKHDQRVKEGYSLYNAGLTQEALAVAQAAVEENALSANALSLLGMCYERMGQLAEALDCYERVLTITPDAPLERMKVNQLRNNLTQHIKSDVKLNKKIALATGACAMVIVVIAGVFLATFGTRKAAAATIPNSNVPSVEEKAFTPPTNATTTSSTASNVQTIGSTSQPVQQNPLVANPQPLRPVNRPQNDDSANSDSNTDNRTDNSQDDTQIKPVDPKLLQNPVATIPMATMADPTPKPNTGDPAPTADSGAKTAQAAAPQPQPANDDPGVIEITVSHKNAQSASATAEPSGNQLQALMRAARNEFLVGHYDSAARSYERALQHGGDQAVINQRLGMCYEKLGRTSDAVAAYNSAANAYQYALNSGRGDSKRLKSGLDSCKQALKLLKG